jgi:transposase-like protein
VRQKHDSSNQKHKWNRQQSESYSLVGGHTLTAKRRRRDGGSEQREDEEKEVQDECVGICNEIENGIDIIFMKASCVIDNLKILHI